MQMVRFIEGRAATMNEVEVPEITKTISKRDNTG